MLIWVTVRSFDWSIFISEPYADTMNSFKERSELLLWLMGFFLLGPLSMYMACSVLEYLGLL